MATCLAGGYGLMATLLIFVIDVWTWLWVLVSGGADCAWEPPVSYGGFWKNFLFCVAASSRRSHVEIWTLFLKVLHSWAVCGGFCYSVQLGSSMKSSSSSRAPCELVSATVAAIGHLWSCTSRDPPSPAGALAGWPDRLAGVMSQEQVQRHTVVQIVGAVPGLPTLDVLVPLMVEQLVDVLRCFDALVHVPEQVFDVPKIILEDIPTRIFRDPQLAEQLVEVPTEPAFVGQTVDTPVPRGRVRCLQGFLPEQSSTASVAVQNVPVPGGGLYGSGPGQGSAESSSFSRSLAVLDDADEALEGFFRTSQREESARVARQVSAQLGGHVSSSTLSAHQNGSCWSRRALEPIQPRRLLG